VDFAVMMICLEEPCGFEPVRAGRSEKAAAAARESSETRGIRKVEEGRRKRGVVRRVGKEGAVGEAEAFIAA
jgi:hypothetical protein